MLASALLAAVAGNFAFGYWVLTIARTPAGPSDPKLAERQRAWPDPSLLPSSS